MTDTRVLTDDQTFARDMAAQQMRELLQAVMTVQSRADGFVEFASEVEGGIELTHDQKAAIAATVDRLQTLYYGGVS